MKQAESIQSEQSVIGALLNDNDAIDRCLDLKAEHFYRLDHQTIFTEICRQIAQGKQCDVITVYEALSGKIDDCLPYLNSMSSNSASSANIGRYADVVIDKAIKRGISVIAGQMIESTGTNEGSTVLVDRFSSQLEQLAQKKTKKQPEKLSDMLGNYVELIEARMEGKIKPISTGHDELDKKLGGGLERGTVAVVAGRPAMGKTAFGLGLARNVSSWGSALFLSMEMPATQVNDRNISALGRIPISWLRAPDSDNSKWTAVTAAFGKAQDLNLYIDDQTALSMIDIRNKARQVKRKAGLDILVIDQLSFITGSSEDKKWDAIGEYTRALLQIAKELDIAVVLLCQLNRDCEKRPNKRPQLSDLAMSGSIEQDAAYIFFLYRDEVYNPDSPDIGICEVNTAKQRQGSPGTIALAYIGDQTRFESLAYQWQRREEKPKRSNGFD